ncbi:MAG: hypothetical protein G01um101448_820 [Parcubacteria group bacterium Gr01-1014_48]|nr:MAG: hypothetical protein G01um101448_820 [Parcubacteria group bacterium Gr01-1014_48]TSC99954.1 MAG: hypothetical protein Greene101415_1024 [Parcubacteria group bacterium Greene1014_15]TSD07408.1 MAG: hypothetical protein Greene07144_900 [Parcubacteria group bacterium Greene0714_4]
MYLCITLIYKKDGRRAGLLGGRSFYRRAQMILMTSCATGHFLCFLKYAPNVWSAITPHRRASLCAPGGKELYTS